MSYIAHSGEGFIYWSDRDTSVGESATRYWVGITPRLAIRDEAGGFARFEPGTEFGYYTVAYLAPFALDDGPYLVDVQVRFTGEWSTRDTAVPVALGITTEEGGTYLAGFGDNIFGLSVGPWHDATVEVFIHSSDLAAAVGAAASGQMFIAFQNNSLGPDEGYDLSFLGLRGAALIPLRWRNRNDGLSGGPKQARGVSSQQVGRQHRGYL